MVLFPVFRLALYILLIFQPNQLPTSWEQSYFATNSLSKQMHKTVRLYVKKTTCMLIHANFCYADDTFFGKHKNQCVEETKKNKFSILDTFRVDAKLRIHTSKKWIFHWNWQSQSLELRVLNAAHRWQRKSLASVNWYHLFSYNIWPITFFFFFHRQSASWWKRK